VPNELITDFDIFDETIVDEVNERLEQIQNTTSIAYSPSHGGYWMVTSYEDVYEVIRNDDIYSATRTSVRAIVRQPPLHYDPPEHGPYRTLVNPVFSPARSKVIEDEVRELATSLIDRFASRGSCEFKWEFAHPLVCGAFL